MKPNKVPGVNNWPLVCGLDELKVNCVYNNCYFNYWQWFKEFLIWLEMEVKVIDCPEGEKSKLMISQETMTGIRITGTSYYN